VTVLASVAHGTEEIGIGTSILPIYSRWPALLGQTAATLQEVADGGFRLGLGPSGPVGVENWHGVDYGNPLRRLRETVEIVGRVLSGEDVSYDGEYFDLEGFRLRCDPPEHAPAIDTAGMGPKAVELAGRFADGWHGMMLTRDGLRDRLGDLECGADLGGREPGHVTMSLTCCALEDRERARHLVRQHTAFYVGGMGTVYRDALSRQGHGTVAREIHDAWQAGERERAIAALDCPTFRRHPAVEFVRVEYRSIPRSASASLTVPSPRFRQILRRRPSRFSSPSPCPRTALAPSGSSGRR
jgi:coenzyme F420-dependent oxidoreductase